MVTWEECRKMKQQLERVLKNGVRGAHIDKAWGKTAKQWEGLSERPEAAKQEPMDLGEDFEPGRLIRWPMREPKAVIGIPITDEWYVQAEKELE